VLALNLVDYHLLSISRELVKANELEVALEHLSRIVVRQYDLALPGRFPYDTNQRQLPFSQIKALIYLLISSCRHS
jgi:hypothetical protein